MRGRSGSWAGCRRAQLGCCRERDGANFTAISCDLLRMVNYALQYGWSARGRPPRRLHSAAGRRWWLPQESRPGSMRCQSLPAILQCTLAPLFTAAQAGWLRCGKDGGHLRHL